MSAPFRPKLRSLEIIPFEARGEEMLLLRDRLGIADDAAVPRALAPILRLLDGTRTPDEIIASLSRHHGETLPEWFIDKIIKQLDEALLLASPTFIAAQQVTMMQFTRLRRRPAAHAGATYPEKPEELRQLLDGYFSKAVDLDVTPRYTPESLRGIMVPHIDFHRGGPVEALAYGHLSQAPFDTVIILGIAHCGIEYPYCAAPMDYDTPLGIAHLDAQFLDALESQVGPQLRAEQFAHKNEHSIEFVTIFLQHLPQFRDSLIVPILCGGLHQAVRRGIAPNRQSAVAEFCHALRNTVDEWEAQGKRVGIIASVDLAHVGSRFGDHAALTDERLAAIESADREFLSCAEAGDAESLHGHIARDNNRRNVDAHPALYALFTAFPEWRGQLLHYAQAFDAAANSVVSFASMVLYTE